MSQHLSTRSHRISSARQQIKKLPLITKRTLEVSSKLDKQRARRRSNVSQNDLTDFTDNHMQESEEEEAEESGFITNSFSAKYELKQKLGEGASGCVYRCRHQKSGKEYAVKIFGMEEQHVVGLKRSFIHLKQLRHSTVVKYRALYLDQDKRSAYLVMQYLTFPDLLKSCPIPEQILKHIVRKLLEAIQYIHSHNLCHRDIKPQNILFCPFTQQVKLIDFGISKKTYQRGVRRDMLTITGTPFYLAPEVYIGGGYDQRVDLWALGISIYRIISGRTPFESEYHSDTVNNIIKSEVIFDQSWQKVQPLARDFVTRLLKPRKQRISVKQALKHFWLQDKNNTRKDRLSRSTSQFKEMHQQFHNEVKQNLKNAMSKEQGQQGRADSLSKKVLYKNINMMISVSEYDLEDSDDEESIVSSPSPLTHNFPSIHDFSSGI